MIMFMHLIEEGIYDSSKRKYLSNILKKHYGIVGQWIDTHTNHYYEGIDTRNNKTIRTL